MTCGSPRWNREALLANPAFESLWPVIALCPSDRFPGAGHLSDLARWRGVESGGGAPLRFVSGGKPPPGPPGPRYEVRIYRDGEVPTRPDNFHDLFNALAWLVYPRTKALLNRRHYQELTARRSDAWQGAGGYDPLSRGTARPPGSRGTARLPGSRGTARDVLTLFDESGVIVACGEPELAALLRRFEWKTLFWKRRAELRRAMRFLLFGHAIHEKALHPYKGITARALVFPVSPDFPGMPLDAQLAQADAWAADYLAPPHALDSTRVLAPLPILGVPGWEAANGRESFYDDASVFRSARAGNP